MTAAERRQRRQAFDLLPPVEQQAIRDRLQSLLEARRWTFARTMPENPHEWSLRKDWPRDDDFCWAVTMIRTLGTWRRFERARYLQLDVNGFTYWSMGRPLFKADGTHWTRLINRKRLTESRVPLLDQLH